MKLAETNEKETPLFKGKAYTVEELLASINGGRFTLDGRKLIVRGNLSLVGLGLTSLLGCPQRVLGNFNCASNKLETLEGAPQVVNGSFNCYNNRLKTLAGAPQRVSGNFICYDNDLKTLEGGPAEVGGSYICSYNQLTTLKGMPDNIKGDLWCGQNQLTSFAGCARIIGGNLFCHNNKLLTSLEGGPDFVKGNVRFEGCTKLISIKNIHHHFPEVHGAFDFTNTKVKEDMLGLLLVRGLQDVILRNTKLRAILRKYLNSGNLLACALELVEAGYEKQARL
jgi:hypothetical protein